jgi:hypothetical protein
MRKIDLRKDVRSRWLLGVPLLLLGALCINSARDQRKVTNIVFGACLTAIAIVLLAERRLIVVDAQAGRLSSKRGVFYPFTLASFALADVKHIALVSCATKAYSGGTGQRHIRYRLLVNGRPSSILADLGNQWHARGVDKRVSVALNVPFDNTVFGPHSLRQPNELETPLAERWQRAGEVHERPALPAGSRLVVDESGSDVLVSLPAQTYNRKWLALVMLAFFGMATLMYSTAGIGMRWLLHVFFAMATVFFALVLLASSGRSRLRFTSRKVSFRQGLSPLSSSLEFGATEELIPAWDGIDLVGDSGRVWIHWPETEADSAFLQARVAYEIARRTGVAAAHGLEVPR